MMRLIHSLEAATSVLLLFQVNWLETLPRIAALTPAIDGGNLLIGAAGAGLFLRVYWLQIKELDRLQARVKGLEAKVEEIEDSKTSELEHERNLRHKSQEDAMNLHLVNEQLMTRLKELTDEADRYKRQFDAIRQGRRAGDDEGAGI